MSFTGGCCHLSLTRGVVTCHSLGGCCHYHSLGGVLSCVCRRAVTGGFVAHFIVPNRKYTLPQSLPLCCYYCTIAKVEDGTRDWWWVCPKPLLLLLILPSCRRSPTSKPMPENNTSKSDGPSANGCSAVPLTGTSRPCTPRPLRS